MRLASLNIDGSTTVAAAADGDLVDLGPKLGLRSLREAIAGGVVERLAEGSLRVDGPSLDGDSASFLPPVPDPRRVLCAGFNYAAHAAESDHERPEQPTFFVRFASSHVGHRQPIVRPQASEMLDWEGELAVVIGREGRHVAPEQALSHVAGYTCFADNSVRDYQMHGTQATAGKNFERSGSFGPWLTTADEVGDPEGLEVITRLNGEQVQHGKLRDLVFGIPALVAYVSTFTRLQPGDVIATGTPSGIGLRRDPPRFLAAGDVLEVEVPGVGRLENPVMDEAMDEEIGGTR